MPENTLQKKIHQVIVELRGEYITDKFAPSYYEINNGLCDEFGEEVVARLEPETRKDAFTVEGANFMVDDGRWDSALLQKSWKMAPPRHLTWSELDDIRFGNHVWVTDGAKHYDAEAPSGVDSFFELPIFRRFIISHLRSNGIFCPDVLTEDVTPAPLCHVPNPKLPTEATV